MFPADESSTQAAYEEAAGETVVNNNPNCANYKYSPSSEKIISRLELGPPLILLVGIVSENELSRLTLS